MNLNLQNNEVTLVSKEHYETLSKYIWSKNADGYVIGKVNRKSVRLHRFLMIELEGKDLTRSNIIDHINNNKLDNRLENLRIVTSKENARNKIKKKNTSSKYFNVTYDKDLKKWRVKIIKNDGTLLSTSFKNEIDAAYQYNLWIIKFNLTGSNPNDVTKPDNFKEWVEPIKREYPKSIYFESNQYKVRVFENNKMNIIGKYKTLEEAKKVVEIELEKKKKKKLDDIKSKAILRNKDGYCIINTYNKNKEITSSTIVDEEDYYDLMKYKWSIYNKTYIQGYVNGKMKILTKYLLKYDGTDYIDHINNNPLDNRKCNLRILTPQQNSFNRKSKKDSSSKFIGVSYNKRNNNWIAVIHVNNKGKYLGSFKDEIDAAKARDIATKEHFGEFGNLNFPDQCAIIEI